MKLTAGRLLTGQHALIGIVAGVTWLALMGAVLSGYIVGDSLAGFASAHSHSLPAYAAYNTGELVPTSFGSLLVTRAELTSRPDQFEVHVSMRVDNNQDDQIDAPRFEDLRLIDTAGKPQATPKPGAWTGPAVVLGHSSGAIDLTYVAPSTTTGLLWLEYTDRQIEWPLRVALGTARAPQAPQPAAIGLGDSQ